MPDHRKYQNGGSLRWSRRCSTVRFLGVPVSGAESLTPPLHPLSWPRVSLVTWPSCAPSHCSVNCTGVSCRSAARCHDPANGQQAGVAEVEIGPHRLGSQTHAPGVFRILPQGEIGFGQGVGFFFLSKLEVDAAVVGLNVGEAWSGFAAGFRRSAQPECWKRARPVFPDSSGLRRCAPG